MASAVTYLENLTREMDKEESEVMALAFRIGLRHLWRDHVLGLYLRHKITRDEAIEKAGIDWVELAERQNQAMEEDLEWALRS